MQQGVRPADCKGASVSCRLLAQLGAGQGGPVQVVVTDVREEMVAYVAGRPYLRRELEMPAAAFHHAGSVSVIPYACSPQNLHAC
jgi:hypothetical protein